MIKTPSAGSTAKGGILGRRKRRPPEPASFVTMWQKTENGRPVLVRCLLSEARKSVAAATLPDRENDPIKSGRNAGVLGAQKSPSRSARARCRYCGAASEGTLQICLRCEQIRERHEAAAEGWIGDDKLYLRVQRTLANRERAAAAEQLKKHGPGRLEREGPAVKMSEAVDKAKRAARATFRPRSAARATGGAEFAEAAA
jgi:hypothetical protein